MQFIDSHCHLNFDSFDEDRDAVWAQANAANVHRLINPSIDLETSRQAVALAQHYQGVYAAIGFHPYDASLVDQSALKALTDLSKDEKVVSIGEIGLDYYRDRASKEDQLSAFEVQLDLAKTLDLPVIIHQREAADDMMTILRRWGTAGNHPGLVLHAFSGDAAMAEEAADLGFYIGIGGPITFKNSRGLPDIVRQIPLDRIIIETDAPYLTPHPHRGKRNEPAHVSLVAEKLAEIFMVDLVSFADHVTRNTELLFRLPKAN
ncbi:MAG: TatD family hydrolase [Chloroflexota bacterium]